MSIKPIKFFIFILINLFYLLSFAQTKKTDLGPLITDRPDATEAPNLVPKGYLQVETGALYQSFEENSIKNQEFIYNTTLVRVGILDNFELRIGWDFVERQTTINGNQLNDISSGLNPLLLGTKIGITDEKGWLPQIGLIGHLYLPFTAGRDYRPDTTGVDFRFAFAHTLSENSSLSYNLGAQWRDDSPETAYIYTIAYGYSFTNVFGMYVELYGNLPEDSKSNHLWDAGFTYLISDNVQLDATVGTSITKGQDLLLSAGISFRLPM